VRTGAIGLSSSWRGGGVIGWWLWRGWGVFMLAFMVWFIDGSLGWWWYSGLLGLIGLIG